MKPKSLCVPRILEDFSGRYRRQVDTGSPEQSLGQTAEKKKKKKTREPQFTAINERSQYELLVEEDINSLKDDKKKKKKEKYKKYRKNVGKALRYSWKCLMLGLQNFTVGYTTPISSAATIIPDFHPGGAWG